MGAVRINFTNTMLTSSGTEIIVTNGSFGFTASTGLSITGAIAFNSLEVLSDAVIFNVDPGAAFTGAVEAELSVTGGDPTIEVTNFAGTVTVMWPTATGLEQQHLESGNAMTLSGYAG